MNVYEIRVQGHLDQRWSEWFGRLTISYEGDGSTVLRGPLPDEAALHGVLIKVREAFAATARGEPHCSRRRDAGKSGGLSSCTTKVTIRGGDAHM